MDDKIYDLLVIGGGINGTGIARDAAGRGLSVVLCEQNDLASGTSSLSTKLIHGGLRYLEYGHFKLVRDSLSEREILLHSAPHLIRPLRLVLPQQSDLRPSWLIKAGLFLYDHLGKKNSLPKSEVLKLATSNVGEPLEPKFKKGFAFSDCWVDDARLVIANAIDAREKGADVYNYTPIKKLEVQDGIWHANDNIRARAVVNATGPWIGNFSAQKPRLVKGSHIIVPRQYPGKQAYLIQNTDKRVVFVIPYEDKYELIGTTEVDYLGDPSDAKLDDFEINYLLDLYNNTFKHQIRQQDIVWHYSGVRPLLADESKNPSTISRDYNLKLNTSQGAPCLYIFGGKITTYRHLAEDALQQLRSFFPQMQTPWTDKAKLPGGDFENFDTFVFDLHQEYPWLPEKQLARYARLYGTRAKNLLAGKTSLADLGNNLGADLYQAEVDYLRENEWAVEAEDVLFRRTKVGLHLQLDSL